jgi:hypothetical protein
VPTEFLNKTNKSTYREQGEIDTSKSVEDAPFFPFKQIGLFLHEPLQDTHGNTPSQAFQQYEWKFIMIGLPDPKDTEQRKKQ